MTDASPMSDFADVWQTARSYGGWLTDDQARLLWARGSRVRAGGCVVEVGSHQGKSTCVLAAAAPADATVVAVDLFEEGFGPGSEVARQRFEANLTRLGVRSRVDLRPVSSAHALKAWSGPIDLLYIDAAHDYSNVVHDLRWTEFVVPDGTVLVHDAFSSVGVTLAFLRHVVWGSHLTYVGRAQSLAEFTASRPTARDRWRMLAQLPWFVRNVAIKVLLVLHLPAIARLLGHHQGRDFPY